MEASANRTSTERVPEVQIPADKAPVAKASTVRPANKLARDEREFYLDDGHDAYEDNDDMQIIEDDYAYERPARKEPERDPAYKPEYEERPLRKESAPMREDTYEERPVRKESAPEREGRRTYTRETDLEDQLQDSVIRAAAARRESVFTNISEDTTDIGMALKQAKSDYSRPGASGETRDFDLDLLEKNLGRMTSEVMDMRESDSRAGRGTTSDSDQSRYTEGRNVTAGRSTRYGSVDVTEISDNSDFNTDFIEL